MSFSHIMSTLSQSHCLLSINKWAFNSILPTTVPELQIKFLFSISSMSTLSATLIVSLKSLWRKIKAVLTILSPKLSNLESHFISSTQCTCLQSIIFSAFVNLDWYSFMIDYKDYYIITHFFFAVNGWSWLGCGQCEGNCHSAPAWQLDLHFQTHFWLLSDWLSTTSALTLNTAQRHNIERNELMPQENDNNIWTTVLRRDLHNSHFRRLYPFGFCWKTLGTQT